MSTLQFNGLTITLIKKRIKNINLRILRDGSLIVSAPLRCALQDIQAFIQNKQQWILKHQQQFLSQPLGNPPHHFNTGECHLFLGQSYPIVLHDNTHPQRVVLENNQIACYLGAAGTLATRRQLFHLWYRQQMNLLLPTLIQKWEPKIGVQVSEWGVKAMKTRWGSCNPSQQRIWMNRLLIHTPLACIEYVLVHEMVHLLEASHNQRFYQLMSQFLPGWKACKTQLNTYSLHEYL